MTARPESPIIGRSLRHAGRASVARRNHGCRQRQLYRGPSLRRYAKRPELEGEWESTAHACMAVTRRMSGRGQIVAPRAIGIPDGSVWCRESESRRGLMRCQGSRDVDEAERMRAVRRRKAVDATCTGLLRRPIAPISSVDGRYLQPNKLMHRRRPVYGVSM
jgi:hypothetical protein